MNTPRAIEHVSDFSISNVHGFCIETRPRFERSLVGIARLASKSGDIKGTEIDWGRVDRSVQDIFSGLTQRILAALPRLIWEEKSYRSRTIKLATYRIFGRSDDADFDRIYVGLTCHEEGSGIRITGDISGEESGRVYLFGQECERVVEAVETTVLETASGMARWLAMHDRIVVEAVGALKAGISPD